jgi:lipoprotein-releasing system permease protein
VYRLSLCFRYATSRFLTIVATVGVLLGVGLLVVVMAVMNGFVRDLRESIRGGSSDVIAETDVTGVAYYDEFIQRVKTHPNVAEATPVVQLYGLIRIETPRHGLVARPCLIFGVRPDALMDVSKFKEFLTRQKDSKAAPDFAMPKGEARRLEQTGKKPHPGCIPGIELVSYTDRPSEDDGSTRGAEGSQGTEPSGVKRPKSIPLAPTGTKITLATLSITEKGTIGSRPIMRPYRVVDKYKSKLFEIDSKYVFIPLEEAQLLGELGDPSGDNPEAPPRVHQIRVALKDYDKANETIADLKEMWKQLRAWELADARQNNRKTVLWGKHMAFSTWEQQRSAILDVYNMQLVGMIIIVGLIVIVAAFLIGAVLTMIVKEKTRDIGILKCLGASNVGVAQIFLCYAAIVSGTGALLGLVLGKLFIFHIDAIEAFVSRRLGINVFSREAYYFDQIPRFENPWHQAIAVVGAIACAVLCSMVAAYRAARLQPVEALRYE